eukprot:TRINITY_DN22505_c0_g1_i1.p2 TRINITY_DN22505_c0_g1~~TRINITY_DN22505_c0_g1_i1.p2  ORF type:complete len:147 (+),score=11.84 TRINITY_DN22505_c0_g1_i1:195-635(+)
MHRVRPGVFETTANFLFPVNILIKLDFPTLDLPTTAISGQPPFGKDSKSKLDLTNVAVLIFAFLGGGKINSQELKSSAAIARSSLGSQPETIDVGDIRSLVAFTMIDRIGRINFGTCSSKEVYVVDNLGEGFRYFTDRIRQLNLQF